MGVVEAKALTAIATKLPAEAVQIFHRAAEKYGMWKGPISHAGLGSDLLALGAGPDVSCPVWTQKMKNDSATVVLIATRVVSDYEELPPAMRKSAGPNMIAQLQRVCRCMVLAKTSRMQILSTEIFSAEWPGLMDKFIHKCMANTLPGYLSFALSRKTC